jgi:hypothetical protein
VLHPVLCAPRRLDQSPQTLRDVQASAAQLWSAAAAERGSDTAAAPSSATEPLALHPYYEPVCILNKCALPAHLILYVLIRSNMNASWREAA